MIHGKPPKAEARSNARFARGADEGVRPYTNRGAPDALVRGECGLVRVSNVVAEAVPPFCSFLLDLLQYRRRFRFFVITVQGIAT